MIMIIKFDSFSTRYIDDDGDDDELIISNYIDSFFTGYISMMVRRRMPLLPLVH